MTRYAANFVFYLRNAESDARRLRAYVDKASAGVLDEPATAQALAMSLRRALDCGALEPADVERLCGLSEAELGRAGPAGAPVTELDLVFRARRMITPEGERPGCVGVRDGSIVAVADSLDAPHVVELGGRRGAAARPRRHPRARQRPRPQPSGRASRPPPARRRPAA